MQKDEVAPLTPQKSLEFLGDVPLSISLELGRATLSIRQLIQLAPGSVLELASAPTEPLNIRVNGNIVAKGEVVVVNDHFGVRVTEVVDPAAQE